VGPIWYPYRCTYWGEFGTEEGTGATCPFAGKIPQNRPLSKLNNRRFALRGMLAVLLINNSDSQWPIKRHYYNHMITRF